MSAGREAVDWFVENKYAKTRSDAVELGHKLYKAGYLQHVTKGMLPLHLETVAVLGSVIDRPQTTPLRTRSFFTSF